MPPASAAFLRFSERFLSRRRPGRALTLLARTSVPVFAPDWFASRLPELGLDGGDCSPLMVSAAAATAPGGGVLAGAPVVIKDALDVRDLPTGLGLRGTGATPTSDAVLVARIRAAGGHIVGKSKMTELGMDGVGALMHVPMPR
jgi:Asp-tRNA(Asn)/Glu-tRNA(Gln) amidotransferase A subunit family amidase